ncbi:MAG TPA: Asp-tRNA(Asn)/Glu-tRNA(Gln) amidotransferase subunit GatA [Verrucomicrobiae bacterium]|jgi:aspartyl-tRNA(Asn)/glutamyl-tRNA(Gln) amidotransferase subunit A|nr:Asp-tRNA(Asn)/Glu-tRNA(Gln) amidotransferase subunit GatA [Verrucomicrobiae bacterium]
MAAQSTAAQIAREVNAGTVSAREVTDATLERIDSVDGRVGAYLTVLHDRAREFADRVDARVAAGERLPLAGVPLAVKDNMCLTGTRTTCGSKILEQWVAPYTATAVARLIDAGAIPMGKANLDEFAMGSSCENSALGVTRNPYDLARVPGGSSGGSAAAVAAHEATVGVGSDTGGSIREPAAFCNVVGFKPTYGRVSRYGLIAFASSLDQIGPFSRTVQDAALTYDAMGGHDPMDSTSLDVPMETTADGLLDDLRGLKIGIVREFDTEKLDGAAHALYTRAYRDLQALGAELVDVTLPTADYGLATYYLIAPAECSSNLARFDGVRYGLRVDGDDVTAMYEATRAAGFGPEVKRRILIGTYALSSGYYDAYYVRAQKARTLISDDFKRAFGRCDLIACPAASSPAFPFNSKSDPYSMYMMDYYTIPMSLAGLPALSVPCGWVDAGAGKPMPMGLQLCAPLLSERLLLGAAHAYEQATNHAQTHAPRLDEAVVS